MTGANRIPSPNINDETMAMDGTHVMWAAVVAVAAFPVATLRCIVLPMMCGALRMARVAVCVWRRLAARSAACNR